MSLLLDTHVWVWSQEDPERIGKRARRRLEDTGEDLFVATISSLEIARLIHVGLLEFEGKLDRWVEVSLDLLRCGSLELSHAVAVAAYQLPGAFHKDPADRILAATARVHGLTLVTADQRLLDYRPVRTLDARR